MVNNTFKQQFLDIVDKLRYLPFARVTDTEHFIRLEFIPVHKSNCYMSITTLEDDAIEVLLDKTATFDKLAFRQSLVKSIICDVLRGTLTKRITFCCGMRVKTEILLTSTNLTHSSIRALTLIMYAIGKKSSVETNFQPYAWTEETVAQFCSVSTYEQTHSSDPKGS